MKIGILTLPLHTNYGGILQAYALQTVLEKMGHKTMMIDKGWPPKVPVINYLKRTIKESVKKLLGHSNQRWHWIFFQYGEMLKEHQYTIQFVNKYIHRRIQRDLYAISNGDFDGFVVGSDQIWRVQHYRPIVNAYLDFTKGWNVKRVAYAASFGTDEWEYDAVETSDCANLLQGFDAVSVRERSGIALCKTYFHREDVQHVLDPTLLLTANDYINRLELATVQESKGNFLVYILDMTEEKQRIVDFIAKQYGLTPFYVNSKCDDKSYKIKDRIQPPVKTWLRGFYDAKYVFTDSFHACAFSLIFNKPFIVYGNQERGMSRFQSLLSLFNLNNRLIGSYDEIANISLEEINWETINGIISKKRTESLGFLEKSLK